MATSDAFERRKAELQFVESAYSTKECWIEGSAEGDSTQIKRRLLLPQTHVAEHGHTETDVDCESKAIATVILSLSIPEGYLSIDGAIIRIDASISFSGKMSSAAQKLAINALPLLIAACRAESCENAGNEAIFPILSCADTWVENEWREVLSVSLSIAKKAAKHPTLEKSASTKFILDRKLIYSHQIIARSKRKSLKDLALMYKIGGYVKIGWPGIIIIEGLHSNCVGFVQEIKKIKWQYLNVRGEQQIDFESMMALEKGRAFPCEFAELEQDEMSTLASLCQNCGLANLFKTCMKIYENNDEQLSADEAQSSRTEQTK